MTVLRSAALLATVILAGCGERDTSSAPADNSATTAAAPALPDGVQSYRVGTARVLALLDGRAPFPADLFQDITPQATSDLLRAGGEATQNSEGGLAWNGSVWAFLVEVDGQRVLVDTGAGGNMPGTGGLAPGLAAASVDPAAINAIVISHMHGDHVGGLIDAGGRPLYPNATLHLHSSEAGYWTDAARAASAPEEERSAFATARRVIEAYGDRVRLFSGPVDIVPGFSAEPLIGHTPGHSVYRLRSGASEMVFIGDMIHSLAVQMRRPEVTLRFDNDAARARAARLAFLSANAGKTILFAGPHFLPGVVTIAREGEAYRATPVAPAR